MEREREAAAPTLHLIKVLKERDQKREKWKQNKSGCFCFVFFPIVYLHVVKMSSLFPKYMGIFAAITWSSSLFHDSGAE